MLSRVYLIKDINDNHKSVNISLFKYSHTEGQMRKDLL